MRLTKTQEGILNAETIIGGAISNICGAIFFAKPYPVERLNATVNTVAKINDAFRLRIDRKSKTQWVEEYHWQNYEVLHFENRSAFESFAHNYSHTPIDEQSGLYDLKIFTISNQVGMIYKFHHLICDAWCFSVMRWQLYQILENDTVPPTYSFLNHAEKAAEYLESRKFKSDRDYFMTQFLENRDVIYFPNLQLNSYVSETITLEIDSELTEKLRDYAQKTNLSTYVILLTAFGIYYSKTHDNSEHFYLGTAVLNRTTQEERNTIGPFLNNIPFLFELNYKTSLKEVAEQVDENMMSAFRHQRFNYPMFQEAIEGEVSDARVYDVVFSFQPELDVISDYFVKWYQNGMQAEPLQIHIDHRNDENRLLVTYNYLVEKYNEAQIQSIHRHYMHVLSLLLSSDERMLCDGSVMTNSEIDAIFAKFNNTAVSYDKQKTVYDLFRLQAEQTPEQQAILFKDQRISFSALLQLIDETADCLHDLRIGKSDVVAVHLDRSPWLIVYQLALLKIGAVFLPVDKRFPKERLQFLCRDCNVRLLITDTDASDISDVQSITPNELRSRRASTSHTPACYVDNCYIIYTSGSTGTPKGCFLKQSGLVNFCVNNNTLSALQQNPHNVFACVNSVAFDYFIAESLLPLLNGYTVVLCDEDESLRQDAFLELVGKHQINVLMTTPTRLALYYDIKQNSKPLQALTCVCSSGEPLPAKLLERIYEVSHEAKVFNPLGPSECTVWDLGGELYRENGIDIHLGKPIANTQIYIVDKYLNPVPIGVTGELCISGDGVGAGYVNRPELSAEKFVENPFGKGKLYKTGDLAYWREDGNIMYVGRNDFQVKIRGLRIELGEIENAISAVEGINQSVVVLRKSSENRQLICAFYTGEEKEISKIRKSIGEKLPKYMLPHIFTRIDEMPLTASGKINRNSLPEVDLENIKSAVEYVAPTTEKEIALAEAIAEVLKVEKISILDNFFEIGGDSIKAIHIVAELQKNGYELPVSSIMQNETVADIAALLKQSNFQREYIQDEVCTQMELSPIMRVYLNEDPPSPETFFHSCIVTANCDETELRLIIDKLVSHHDILRATVLENGLSVGKSQDKQAYTFCSETRFANDENTKNAVEYLIEKKIRFDLEHGPLVDVALCLTKNGSVIKLSIHHFIVDLVSWEILLEDFSIALKQLKNKEQISLPLKTASFPEWIEALNEHNTKTMSDEERSYWTEVNKKTEKAVPLFSKDSKDILEERYTFTLDKFVTDRLMNKVNSALRIRPNELLLAALGLAARDIAGGQVGILAESHGRAKLPNSISIGRTVGWFTSMYPVLFEENTDVFDTLLNVKDTVRHIPFNAVEYLMLCSRLPENISIIFNYFNSDATGNLCDVRMVEFNNGSAFPEKIGVDCSVENGELHTDVCLSAYTASAGLSERLALSFKSQLERLLDIIESPETEKKAELFNSDLYNLTPSQKGIYYQYRIDRESKIYRLCFMFKIGKDTSLETLEQSFDLLLLRHEVLNTAFSVSESTGEVRQYICRSRKPDFRVQKLSEKFSESALEKQIAKIEDEPFDLQNDNLFRVHIIDFSDARFMVLHTHHIIIDGWSIPVLLKDLDRFYKALTDGVGISALTQTIENELMQCEAFSGYIGKLEKQDSSKSLEYWKNLLEDYQPAMLFNGNTTEKNSDSKIETIEISEKELTSAIRQFSKEQRLPVNTIFEAAFGLLLQRYSSADDVAFCKPVSGRSLAHKGIENAVGPFINTDISRIRSEKNQTVEALLNSVQKQSVQANRFGFLQLSELFRQSGLKKEYVNVLFAFENYYIHDIKEIEENALKLELYSAHEQTEFPLSVSVSPDNEAFRIKAIFSTQHFAKRQISDLLESYIYILKQMTVSKAEYLSNIKTLDESQIKVLNGFNDTKADFPKDKSIYELFEESVVGREDSVCIETAEKAITFGEFKKSVEALDFEICKTASGKNNVIAIIANRSVEMYIAIYAAIRGGNAYMPISPDYPKDRIQFMLKDSGASLVLASSEFTDLACGLPCIDISMFDYNKKNEEQTSCLAKPDDAAYVIYTSGSTGTPKGAVISNKSAINRIVWMQKAYPLDENSVILQKTPYTFDVSVWELFWWGMCKGHLAAMKPNVHFMPAEILEDCEKYSVTHLHFVPSVFDLFLSYLELHKEKAESFRSVKHIFLSGEALTAELVNRFYAIFDSEVKLHNLYGPTECAVDVTYYDCQKEEVNPVPIGKPIDNTQIFIVDRYMNIVPAGVQGELCIGGVNVGMGYLNRPELTAERFVDNPFGEGKLYKTGDLACIRDDGEIIFCGRKDFQIKLNGQRVELGEIESVISQHENVVSSAVVMKKHNQKDILVAFYSGKETNGNEFKTFCREKLPSYMVPQAFIHLKTMSLTTSGKIDRTSLTAASASVELDVACFNPPQTPLEEEICQAFRDILDVDCVGRGDNFYDLGGTSLDMIRLLSGKPLSALKPAAFMENPTPASLAQKLMQHETEQIRLLQPLYVPQNPQKVLVLFSYGGGDASAYTALVAEFKKKDADFALYYVHWMNEPDYPLAAQEIRNLAKTMPVHFYSHCAGAVTAMKLLDILNRETPVVASLIAGGNVLPTFGKKPVQIWKHMTDNMIMMFLKSAGLPADELSAEEKFGIIVRFRKNTDQFFAYMQTKTAPTPVSVHLILSKNDLFTKNYKSAVSKWAPYVNRVCSLSLIESKTHYFQTEDAEMLFCYLTKKLKEG